MNAEIRQFSPEYAGQIKPKGVIVLLTDGALYTKPDQWDRFEKDLSKIDEQYVGRSRFWIALDGGNVIGFVGLLEEGKETCRLKRMHVHFDYQRQGNGQSLLDTAISFAKEQGYSRMVLKSGKAHKKAQPFYQKNGFKKIGEDETFFHYSLDL